MCVFLISPVPITKPLTSELIDTPVFYNLAPRPIKYRVSVPIPSVNVVIYWYGQQQNMCCSSSTDAGDVKQELKTFKSAFMLLLVQKEQHKRSFQPHIIISVLQTFKWQEY